MNNPGDTLNDLSANLMLQEYISLKAEIRDMVTEIDTIAKYSILFTGAFVAFLLKEKKLKIPTIFNFLPFIFTSLLVLRSSIIGVHIGRIGDYIRLNIEPKFDMVDKLKGIGWERYYSHFQFPGINMSILGITYTSFWALNVGITFIIGIFLCKFKVQENIQPDVSTLSEPDAEIISLTSEL